MNVQERRMEDEKKMETEEKMKSGRTRNRYEGQE